MSRLITTAPMDPRPISIDRSRELRSRRELMVSSGENSLCAGSFEPALDTLGIGVCRMKRFPPVARLEPDSIYREAAARTAVGSSSSNSCAVDSFGCTACSYARRIRSGAFA